MISDEDSHWVVMLGWLMVAHLRQGSRLKSCTVSGCPGHLATAAATAVESFQRSSGGKVRRN